MIRYFWGECKSDEKCPIKKLIQGLNVPVSLICGYSNEAEHLRCFGDGQLTLCGNIPFETIFMNSKSSEHQNDLKNKDDVVSQFRNKIMSSGKEKSNVQENKTESTNPKKGILSNSIYMKVRNKEIQRIKEDLIKKGHSKLSIIAHIVILEIILLLFCGLIELLILPFRLIWYGLKLIYKIVTFPQKKLYEFYRNKTLKKYYQSCNIMVKEFNSLVVNITNY